MRRCLVQAGFRRLRPGPSEWSWQECWRRVVIPDVDHRTRIAPVPTSGVYVVLTVLDSKMERVEAEVSVFGKMQHTMTYVVYDDPVELRELVAA